MTDFAKWAEHERVRGFGMPYGLALGPTD